MSATSAHWIPAVARDFRVYARDAPGCRDLCSSSRRILLSMDGISGLQGCGAASRSCWSVSPLVGSVRTGGAQDAYRGGSDGHQRGCPDVAGGSDAGADIQPCNPAAAMPESASPTRVIARTIPPAPDVVHKYPGGIHVEALHADVRFLLPEFGVRDVQNGIVGCDRAWRFQRLATIVGFVIGIPKCCDEQEWSGAVIDRRFGCHPLHQRQKHPGLPVPYT